MAEQVLVDAKPVRKAILFESAIFVTSYPDDCTDVIFFMDKPVLKKFQSLLKNSVPILQEGLGGIKHGTRIKQSLNVKRDSEDPSVKFEKICTIQKTAVGKKEASAMVYFMNDDTKQLSSEIFLFSEKGREEAYLKKVDTILQNWAISRFGENYDNDEDSIESHTEDDDEGEKITEKCYYFCLKVTCELA